MEYLAYMQKLKETGCDTDTIGKICVLWKEGNARGQKQLIMGYRQSECSLLSERRWQLACIDYLTTKLAQLKVIGGMHDDS